MTPKDNRQEEARMTNAWTITKDGTVYTLTGGAHDHAYEPVTLNADEVNWFIQTLQSLQGMSDIQKITIRQEATND